MMNVVLLVTLIEFSFVSVHGLYQDGDNNEIRLPEGSFCRTRDNLPGYCTLIGACEPYLDGLIRKTIPYSFLVRCSFQGPDEIICCPGKLSGRGPETSQTEATIPADPTTHKNERPSEAACRRYSEDKENERRVSLTDYPHMGALISRNDDGTSRLHCGCSLIAARYALTSAHCLNNPISRPTTVRFGIIAWNSTKNDSGPYDIEIENTHEHPKYKITSIAYDIAVVKFLQNINFNSLISPACLSSGLDDIDSAIKLVVVGWDKLRLDVLYSANISTVSLKECKIKDVASELYCENQHKPLKDVCYKDTSLQMQLIQNDKASIVGITSFIHKCDSGIDIPVFLKVAFYLKWIEGIVWPSESDEIDNDYEY